MSPAPHPRMHGLTHVPGGPDPIPGLLPGLGGDTYTGLILSLPSLVGYWKLDETSGDWADSSGHGNDLTHTSRTGEVRGVSAIVEEEDGILGVTVDGGDGSSAKAATYVGSRIDEPDFEFGTVDPFTVIAWVNPSALPGGAFSDGICGSVDFEAAEAAQGWGLYVEASGDAATFRRRDETGAQADAMAATPIETAEWTMLAGVFTGSAVELYVNGLLVDTTAATGSLTVGAAHSFYVGSVGISEGVGSTWAPFQGSIDSVALVAADIGDQINALYETGTGLGTIPDGYVLTSDGEGGSGWEAPTGGGGGVDTLAKDGDTGLTGDVTLSEGANVTLTQVGQDIEIAATGGGPFVDTLAAEGETPLTGDITLSEGAGIALTQTGQDIEIAATGGGGLGDAVDIQEFTGSGTWTKPAGASTVEVVCIGGGGQGGGGASAVSTAKSGGGGGGGGAVTRALFRAADLAGTVAVTVGAGGTGAGTGGAAGAGANGVSGGNGGLSSFGTHLVAGGGGGGVNGSASNPVGGGGGGAITSAALGVAGTPASTGNGIGGQGTPGTGGAAGFYADWGGGAGGGSVTNGQGRGGGSTMYGCPGGGAGGGVSVGNVGFAGGGAGTSPSITPGTQGGGGAINGNGSPGSYTGPYSGSGGSGGGGGSAGNAGGTGGAGFRGSGGGGGGAGSNSSGSANGGGTGGDGGGGHVRVISW